MKLRFGLLFLVLGLSAGVPLYGDQAALLARYAEVRALRGAATEEMIRNGYDKQLADIAHELANINTPDRGLSQPKTNVLQVPELPVVPEVSYDLDERKTTLATKLDTVFNSFINKNDLDSHAIVLAETMKHYFIVKLEQFNDTPQAIQAEIIVFVEMARLLLCRMQLIVGSPTLVRTLFGELPLAIVEKKRLNDLFVKALYAVTFTDAALEVPQSDDIDVMAKYVRGALVYLKPWPLVDVLVREGVITDSWRIDYHAHRTARHMASVFSVLFSTHLIDLMQQFINLEKNIETISSLKNSQQDDAFVRTFVLQADGLISKLLKEYAVLHKQNDAAAVWANLFIGKTILLKRSMLVRVQVARGGKYEKMRREVYIKNDVLAQDPLFNEVIFIPALSGYASRYETVVTNFLMGKIDPAIDYYRDHQMLLAHLRSLVAKITPQGWRTYVCGVTGNGVYASLFNNMITILEDIGRALQFGDSMFGAAQGFIADLLSDKGLLAGLAGKELQVGASKLGLSIEQLRTVLNSSAGDPKEVVLRLIAHASPLLLRGIVDYVRNPESKPVLKVVSPPGGGADEARPAVSSDLIKQIERKAPGLLDLLTSHVKAELTTQSA